MEGVSEDERPSAIVVAGLECVLDYKDRLDGRIQEQWSLWEGALINIGSVG